MKARTFHQTMHVNEGELQPETSTCPFCGSEDRVPVSRLQDSPDVSLLRCRGCQAASASRIPTDLALESYYKQYYDPSCQESDVERVTFAGSDRFARHLASGITKHLDAPATSILDFGGGDGSIAVKTAERLLKPESGQINIMVVDYNEVLARVDNKRISLAHEKTLDNLSGHYDVIIASTVLEHLPRPMDTLLQLLNLLSHGGVFYARTPYVVPLVRLFELLRLKWDFAYPIHLHDMGPDFWRVFLCKMLRDDRFRLVVSKPSIVETSLRTHFFKTVAAYALKALWYLLGSRYRLVGGWEVFIEKKHGGTDRCDEAGSKEPLRCVKNRSV